MDAAAQRALWGNLLGTGQRRKNTGEVELQFGVETTWTRDRLWCILSDSKLGSVERIRASRGATVRDERSDSRETAEGAPREQQH